MTTASRRKYFRRNIGDPGDGNTPELDVFSDEEIDDIFTELDTESIGDPYSNEKIIRIKAVIVGFDWLRSDAIKQVDYMQNDSRIEADSIPKEMAKLQQDWIKKLNEEVSSLTGPAYMSGVTRRIPARRKAYPDA